MNCTPLATRWTLRKWIVLHLATRWSLVSKILLQLYDSLDVRINSIDCASPTCFCRSYDSEANVLVVDSARNETTRDMTARWNKFENDPSCRRSWKIDSARYYLHYRITTFRRWLEINLPRAIKFSEMFESKNYASLRAVCSGKVTVSFDCFPSAVRTKLTAENRAHKISDGVVSRLCLDHVWLLLLQVLPEANWHVFMERRVRSQVWKSIKRR